MLGEFLSANVSTPFLLFMVRGAGSSRQEIHFADRYSGLGDFKDEADVAFSTGILGVCIIYVQYLLLRYLYSFNLFLDTVRHVPPLGAYQRLLEMSWR